MKQCPWQDIESVTHSWIMCYLPTTVHSGRTWWLENPLRIRCSWSTPVGVPSKQWFMLFKIVQARSNTVNLEVSGEDVYTSCHVTCSNEARTCLSNSSFASSNFVSKINCPGADALCGFDQKRIPSARFITLWRQQGSQIPGNCILMKSFDGLLRMLALKRTKVGI